jgi:hypothetical protein
VLFPIVRIVVFQAEALEANVIAIVAAVIAVRIDFFIFLFPF